MSEALRALEARVERVERQNRRLRALVVVLPLVALLAGAAFEAREAKKLSAEEVTLTDQNGRVRLRMAADLEGKGPCLFMYTDKGRLALASGQNKDNGIGFVEFFDNGEWKGGVGGSAFKK